MNLDLFDDALEPPPARQDLAPGAVLLRGRALAQAPQLLAAAEAVMAAAALRHWLTPGGRRMAVAMTNCGPLGWVSDARGYRYQSRDPLSCLPWPALPPVIAELAVAVAKEAGYPGFRPDACLVNRYLPGTPLSLHQDRDEQDLRQPIVSISLGLPAMFLFGGLSRSERPARWPLQHGDVLVWGGPSRLAFHGVQALAPGRHPLLGEQRINLTLRCAG
ncbi:DNA oxidative demethylase AlkB [Paucibacter sp. DJ2R-2]|uniref:DNA oxidative demethylase AlkB n=1 Tax=Paucibacter sp. DJ2R-2 TaxID=2893558 RepID=UPI0021E4EA75|nr:DNA oxidative demethylase AlkB [Paucibacter sp. DJ2R-2]MCV2420197.1 DNA oxidative demethylase AlkB [Paucibacter sp. DJ4R-1]MCV2436858.1 DNA oxidative demethylase AlkB [Paucibacter sp. DJ2R-2]